MRLWKCKYYETCNNLVTLTKEQDEKATAQEKRGEKVDRREYVCVDCASSKSVTSKAKRRKRRLPVGMR